MKIKPRPLLAGNWKMNGMKSVGMRETKKLKSFVSKQTSLRCEILICPPATLLAPMKAVLKDSKILLGGQDCHYKNAGAHTGDISAEMLYDIGCRYVIVGHSERRTGHNETNRSVRDKAVSAIKSGLTPIICVGENQRQRKQQTTLSVVGAQLTASLPKKEDAKKLILAYEPIWAIGTGLVPALEDIHLVHSYIRGRLHGRYGDYGGKIRILYGGSVKKSNSAGILSVDNVDGALVGGASLLAKDFGGIISSYL